MGIYRGRVQDHLVIPVSVSVPRIGRERPGALIRGRIMTLVLDSGSKYCSLSPDIITDLGLPAQRSVRVRTHLGEGSVRLFNAGLAFPTGSLAPLAEVTVAALPMPSHLTSYRGVIGREVLERWEVFYSGPRGRLTIRDYRSLWGWLFS